jgi:AbrB family looped-hinge helix DNA binding protein
MIDRDIVKGCEMDTVTVSPKYQIVIPKAVRDAMGLEPGQKLRVFRDGRIIHLVPVRPIKEARGMFPGIDTHVPRDPDRV